MTEPNEQQIELMRKYKLIPENWMVLEERKKDLIVLCKRKCRRRVLKKEGVE